MAEDGPIVIALAHAQAQDATADPAAAMASEFRRQLDGLSGGSLKGAIYPDSQLGGNRDMAKLVAKGVVQSALVSVGGVAPLYPPIAVTAMPFALDNPEAAYALYDGPFGQALSSDIESKSDLLVLGYGDSGGMHILTNSTHPVHSPADMAGLKIRSIPGYEALDVMIRAMGATPVNVSSREELPSLEAHAIDGQMSSAISVLSRHYDLVQGYATVTGHLYAPYVWIYNRAAFAKLSLDQQAMVREAARRAIAAGRSLSARLEVSNRGTAGLSKRMDAVVLTPDERAAFKAVTQPKVAEALDKTLGEEGVRLRADFMAAAAKANASHR
jgi:TRAP-type C4-dicarboxylate transport system substrate-binding protein